MAAKLSESPRARGPQVLDGAHDDEVGEAVRVLARAAAHQVERVAVDVGGRHELAEGGRHAVGVEADREEQALVAGSKRRDERHREAPLHLAARLSRHQPPELRRQCRVGVGGIVELDRVAVLAMRLTAWRRPLLRPPSARSARVSTTASSPM